MGRRYGAAPGPEGARLGPLPPATYAVTAWTDSGPAARAVLVVPRWPGESPVPAFATSLASREEVEAVADWTRRLGATVVQVYDWMASYSHPDPPGEGYRDPLGRPLSRSAVQHLTTRLREAGSVAQAYAAVCAADPEVAETLPEERLYRTDGRPEHLGDLLSIMHPGHPGWQGRWLEAYRAAERLGFDGLHLDTYGYPRAAVDAAGRPVDMTAAYTAFALAVRQAFPDWLITFNQVNGHPAGFAAPPRPSARYAEVWPPHDRWRHLEGLVGRLGGGDASPILAIYPPVWGGGDREAALRTCCLTEAVVSLLGADALIWGDRAGVLQDPYYPRHQRLSPEEAERALTWHRFALRFRDLWRRGTDTTWEDVGGVNDAVRVTGAAPVAPEPLGGAVWARVRRGRGWVAISLLNLTGSADGSWSTPTAEPRPVTLQVDALLPDPQRWSARLAVLDQGGPPTPVPAAATPHPGGIAQRVEVPLLRTWAVVLLRTEEATL